MNQPTPHETAASGDSSAEQALNMAVRKQIRWHWMRRAGVISAFVLLLILGIGPTLPWKGDRGRGRSETVANAKSIGLALFNFEWDYGSFPSPDTVKAVISQNPPSTISLGTKSSNDFFRQLFVAGHTDCERPFFARIKGSRKPDNNMTGTHALEKGECGFAYILGADAKSPSERPLVITPLIPGTTRFDPKPFKGRAVVLRIDQSVTDLPINKKGEAIDATGKNILDPSHPVWGGKAPIIAWPE